MKLDNGDVLFTCRLLGLDQASCIVDADNEATSNFRVERSRVTSLVDLQDFLDPSNDFVR